MFFVRIGLKYTSNIMEAFYAQLNDATALHAPHVRIASRAVP